MPGGSRTRGREYQLDGAVIEIEGSASTVRATVRGSHEYRVRIERAQDLLRAANLAHARLLLVAIPDAFETRQIVLQARADNPTIEILARAHFDVEVDYLSQISAVTVVMGEREIARAMLEHARNDSVRQYSRNAAGGVARPRRAGIGEHRGLRAEIRSEALCACGRARR